MKTRIPFRYVRLLVQAAFFAGIAYLFLSIPYPVAMPYSTLPLSADPLAAVSGVIFSRGAWLPALLPVAAFLLGAVVLGRAFCGWACPVGFLNDLAGLVRRGKGRERFGYLQYGVLAAVLLASAVAVDVLSIADPLVIFQRSAFMLWTGTGLPVVLLLILLAALVVPRFWCRALCPLGGMLGLFALLSPFGFRANDKCTRCGKCHRTCPTGAIFRRHTLGRYGLHEVPRLREGLSCGRHQLRPVDAGSPCGIALPAIVHRRRGCPHGSGRCRQAG